MNSLENVGNLNVQLLFETIAKMIGEKEGAEILVKSIRYPEDGSRREEKTAP